MGINESPDRFIGKLTIQKKPPLPLLAVWDFARSPFGPQSTSRASENAAQSS